MESINGFLMGLSVNTRSLCWYVFDVISLAAFACCFPIYYVRKTVSSAKEMLKLIGITVLSFSVVISIAKGIEFATNRLVLLSGVTYFLPYLLLSSNLSAKFTRFNAWESAEILSLSYVLGRAASFVGCTIAGCCQGRSVSWGIYSAVTRTRVVPVQAFECIAVFCLWFVLSKRMKRSQHDADGKIAAVCIAVFGLINVVTDIFTVIQPKLVYMLSVEGVFAFLTMCVGLALLYLVERKPSKLSVTDSL